MQRRVHDGDGRAPGRSCLPVAAGAPVGAVGTGAAALVPRAGDGARQGLLHILIACDRGPSAVQQPEAVSFVCRCGFSLNRHAHYRCCIIDGLFATLEGSQVKFLHAQALTAQDVAAVAELIDIIGNSL